MKMTYKYYNSVSETKWMIIYSLALIKNIYIFNLRKRSYLSSNLFKKRCSLSTAKDIIETKKAYVIAYLLDFYY